MSVQTPTQKTTTVDEQLSSREVRALTEPMAVLDDVGVVAGAADLYEVTSTSTYIVDMNSNDGPRCSCKDHQFRGVDCAHIERVRYATGLKAIPGWVDQSEVDDQLGLHVTDGEPRVAMADGGVAAARADRQSVTETADNLAGRIGFVIGIDAEGDVHVHYPAADEMRVYSVSDDYEVGHYLDERDLEHVRSLEGRPLEHWMQFIAEDRGGWAETTHRAPDGFSGNEVSN